MSVVEVIRQACRQFATRTATVTLRFADPGTTEWCEVETLTYAELYDRTLRFCDALSSLGLQRGDRVAVLAGNCSAMTVSEWACLKTGFVWVALNARSSAEELRLILDDSRPSVLLVDSAHTEMLQSVRVPDGCEVIALAAGDNSGSAGLAGLEWGSLIESAEPREPGYEPGPEMPVRIRYTSGTSGRPKGAVLPRRAYDASVAEVSRVVGHLEETDTLFQIAPMTHASGAMWLPHARVGARAVLLDRFDAHTTIEVVERYCVTATFLVPTMLVRLLDSLDDPARLSSLRTIVYGGASMPVGPLRKALATLGQRFVQIYGLTESTWPVTALCKKEHPLENEGPDSAARLASCGRPTRVGELRIVSPDGSAVETGGTGEIVVRGDNTMLGYWRRSANDETADAKGLDDQGWMHTGDLGFQDEQGFVTIVDRLHDMIVTGGFNVYPKEVEDCLCRHQAVLEAAVVGVPDEEWGERVCAGVVLKEGASVTEGELTEHCVSMLAGFKKPRSIEIVDELPKSAAGKVLRRAVRDRLCAAVASEQPAGSSD